MCLSLPFFLDEVQKETPISWRIHVEKSQPHIKLAAVQVHRERDTSCLPTMETPLLKNMGLSLILGYYIYYMGVIALITYKIL